MPHLDYYFSGISIKLLSAVETQRHTSNQHEFNGTAAMKAYLGIDRKVLPASFIYFGKDSEDRINSHDFVTWYDAREQHPTRSEYRLYFRDNEAMKYAAEGDLLISAVAHDDTMLLIIINMECQSLNEIAWLFGIRSMPSNRFITIDTSQTNHSSQALFNYIAEISGIALKPEKSNNWLEIILDRFGPTFPKTRDMSNLARETIENEINPINDPDTALIKLIDREEEMFRQLENHIVSSHLSAECKAWEKDVDGFIQFSLSVHNRRKSRAGHALENHLEWILLKNKIDFQRGAKTENRSKPDFLFPSTEQYHTLSSSSGKLTMLGVKTSCKDRWRQVLNEARKIPHKHLLTLQPGISEHQTNEMNEANLTLVIPTALHESYSIAQRKRIINLMDFINMLHQKQNL